MHSPLTHSVMAYKILKTASGLHEIKEINKIFSTAKMAFTSVQEHVFAGLECDEKIKHSGLALDNA